LPRILQLDLQKLQLNRRQELFGTPDFDNGTQLLQLQQKAQNKGLWRAAISELTQQERKNWIKRNRHISEKRQAAVRRNRVGRGANAIADNREKTPTSYEELSLNLYIYFPHI
jgi:hypothetical protein